MFRHRSWIVAAVAAGAVLPLGVTTAAQRPNEPPPGPGLHAPLAGHHSIAGQMHDVIRDRLLARHARLQLRLARLEDRRVRPGALRAAHRLSAAQLEAANRRLQSRASELDVPIDPVLYRIAQCESGGDPRAIGGGGLYRGAFQMAMSTWSSLGGTGDPVNAPLAEQYRRAAMLLARSGPGQWPSCA